MEMIDDFGLGIRKPPVPGDRMAGTRGSYSEIKNQPSGIDHENLTVKIRARR
jgi:hypothetical protein